MKSKGVIAVPIHSTNNSFSFDGSDCESTNTIITMNLRSPKRGRSHFSNRSLTGFSDYTPSKQPDHHPNAY